MHFAIVLLSNQSQFLVLFKSFVRDTFQEAFQGAIHFHRFHSKRIRNWHASNLMHSAVVLLSNQLQFLVMFKSFVRDAFHIANHFHRFHLKQIPNWHVSNLMHSMIVFLSNQSQFLVMFKSFVRDAFQDVFQVTIYFHRFHSKQIPNWHVSNLMHSMIVFLSNQSQFLVMFKSFVRDAFQIAIHFHRFQSKRNRSCHESKLIPSLVHVCRQFLSGKISRSLLVYFHPIVLLQLGGACAEFSEGQRVCQAGWSDGL
jgi:hypothetical protein